MARTLFRFLKATIVGGILFLVPVIVLTIVIGKARNIAGAIVRPLTEWIAVETVAGVALAKLLAIGLIVFICFLAGLFARTATARRMIGWIETALLSNLPGYSFMKGMGESIAGVEGDKPHEPVLARIEDAWQIGFLVERIEGGQAAIYVPGSPSPWSGSLYFMSEDRFRALDIPAASALTCIRRLGVGSDVLLRRRF